MSLCAVWAVSFLSDQPTNKKITGQLIDNLLAWQKNLFIKTYYIFKSVQGPRLFVSTWLWVHNQKHLWRKLNAHSDASHRTRPHPCSPELWSGRHQHIHNIPACGMKDFHNNHVNFYPFTFDLEVNLLNFSWNTNESWEICQGPLSQCWGIL